MTPHNDLAAPWMGAGMVIWALHFTLVYGATAIACARGLERYMPATVGVATVAAAAAALAALIVAVRAYHGFTAWMTAAVAALAALAIVWEGLSAFMVPVCATR